MSINIISSQFKPTQSKHSTRPRHQQSFVGGTLYIGKTRPTTLGPEQCAEMLSDIAGFVNRATVSFMELVKKGTDGKGLHEIWENPRKARKAGAKPILLERKNFEEEYFDPTTDVNLVRPHSRGVVGTKTPPHGMNRISIMEPEGQAPRVILNHENPSDRMAQTREAQITIETPEEQDALALLKKSIEDLTANKY